MGLACFLLVAGVVPAWGQTTPGEATDLQVTGYDPGTGEISLTFQAACGATDHHLEFGPLGAVGTLGYSGQVCGIGNGSYDTFNPGAGSYFFLVVGDDGSGVEGSYGLSRIGGVEAERSADLLDPVCAFTQDLSLRCDGPFTPSLDVTAFRPQTEGYGAPFQRRAVPETEEVVPGAGIRVNGDDDDGNAVPDRDESGVPGENDLIEVALSASPPIPAAGFEYVLRRGGPSLRVWSDAVKTTAILDANDEMAVDLSAGPLTVWAENPSGGSAALALVARRLSDAFETGIDSVQFHPFSGIVIALGGENQVPGDPTLDPGNQGTFEIAITLYQMGYDVHMYDEDVVSSSGAGAAYNEVVRAVHDRGVASVAIYGYSHGGGSTVDLAVRLDQNRATIGTFAIDFTAYVDGIRNNSDIDIATETQLPPTNYHANYYEHPGCGFLQLCGGPITGADLNMNLGSTYTHYQIDDAPEVTSDLLNRLVAHVAR
jgi:hypothetical protein